jgi:enoyl-CoA hydratase/carnithine racemase
MGHELHLVADIRVASADVRFGQDENTHGIKTTLESAHLSIDESEAAAFAKLDDQFGALFHTEDFIEGRRAEAEGRPPVYQGK